MIVLGIDPSLNSTGWAVVEKIGNKFSLLEYGSVVSKAGGDVIEKIKNITKTINQIITKYDLNGVSIEECFVNQNPKSSLKLGMVRGGCIAVATSHDLFVKEYSPKEVKVNITGTGSATKDQMGYMIQHFIGKKIPFKNDDESDAVCVGLSLLLEQGKNK